MEEIVNLQNIDNLSWIGWAILELQFSDACSAFWFLDAYDAWAEPDCPFR